PEPAAQPAGGGADGVAGPAGADPQEPAHGPGGASPERLRRPGGGARRDGAGPADVRKARLADHRRQPPLGGGDGRGGGQPAERTAHGQGGGGLVTALVLASRSAARREMLTRLGLEFEAVDSGLDEAPLKSRLLKEGADPAEVAARLASAKAEAASAGRPGALVLGSDQTLEVDSDLVDKARDLAEARRRLQRLRGRDHILHSAVALAVDGQTVWTDRDQARMTMRPFTD